MTKELARNILTEHIRLMGDEPSLNEDKEALSMAIQALSQISDIKAIINNPMYIQEDVLRYQMICEVVKE